MEERLEEPGISNFPEFYCTCFLQKTYTSACLLTKRNSRRIFTFIKRQKAKTVFRICFAGAVIGSVHTGQKERHYQAPS